MPELNINAMVETFARQIAAAVEASMAERIQATIAGAFGSPVKRGPGRPPKLAAARAKLTAAKKASPKVTRARKLQGQYLGALKSLTGANRAKVKAVAKEKGVAAAVKLALALKKPQ
jgi:hypothetical protein